MKTAFTTKTIAAAGPLAAHAAIALVALTCSACTDNSGNESEAHVLEAQQQALERARDVEQDVAEAARRRAEQIEESENGG